MATNESMRSDVAGARTIPETVRGRMPVDSVLLRSLRSSWKPAAIGAYIGALSRSGNRQKPKYGAVMMSSLLGAAVGELTSSMAWGAQPAAEDMARSAGKKTNRMRDAHWRYSDFT